MSENIIMARGDESGDYTVYDAADVAGSQAAKGFALLSSAAEQAGDFIEVTLDGDGDDVEREKTTSRTARYATEGAAVRHIYIDHDVLAELGGEADDEAENGFDAPDSLGLSVAPSTEDAFEETQEVSEEVEEEAEALLDGVGDDDAVEVEDETTDEEEAEALLEEAEEAA